MSLRTSFAICAVITLSTFLFLFAAIPEAKAQGCDVPPTQCVACHMIPPPKGDPMTFCPMVVCTATVPGGTATGVCTAPCKCGAKTSTDQKGQSQGMGDAKGFMDALKGIADAIAGAMKGKPPKEKKQDDQQQQPLNQQQCTSYYQVTAPTTDPCAYYVPPTSDSLLGDLGLGLDGADALADALEGGALNVSDTLLGASGDSPEETATESTSGTSTSSTTPTTGAGLSGQQVNLQSGTRGDIVVTGKGATFVAQARDIGANTEVAGFYGSDTGGQPQGIISGMCEDRPWGGSIISFVIPPAFFDSLCAWRGYQVGAPAPPSAPVVQKSTPKTEPAPILIPATQTPVSTIPPEVDIWAVPDKVPLGTRTSIFWNTKGVESCSISSPDGNFNEDSITGGAATVPLSGPTTFTISCLTAGGTPVTDNVTVNLSI